MIKVRFLTIFVHNLTEGEGGSYHLRSLNLCFVTSVVLKSRCN